MTTVLPGIPRERLQHIPANLIMGRSGAAKARLLAHWLSLKPRDEHWACLVTEADRSLLPRTGSAGAIDMATVFGGCICCSGSLELRTVLVQLLRKARPHRVLIEAPSTARSTELLRLLHDQWLAPVLDLRAVTLVVDGDHARTFTDEPDADDPVRPEHVGIVVIDRPSDGSNPRPTMPDAEASWPALCLDGADQFEFAMLDLPGPVIAPRFHSGEAP